MAIIDPEGLFHGERLAACSDKAQLYWPRLFVAANNFGRLELSYPSLLTKVFSGFTTPPAGDELFQIFKEYEANFLAILYESQGSWWCQFITEDKYLPRYKTKRDHESPAPSPEMIEDHANGYQKWKNRNSLTKKDLGNFLKFPQNFG